MYKILLVDDEELERKILWFTLQNSGLPITLLAEAASGREALEKVRETRPDLIIMDIKMPGIDGIEATRQIKDLNPATEVLILTAYGKFSYSQQAIKAQATDYLLKPIQPQQLIAAVSQALDRLSRKRFQPGPSMDLTKLEEQVKTGNLIESKRQLDLLLEHLADTSSPLPSLLNSFGLRLMVIVVQAALSAGADPTKLTAIENEMAQNLTHLASLDGLKSWGENLLEKCIGLWAASQQTSQVQIMVRKAMDYIELNFANNISLNTVASHIHLSPAYLSRIFNEKTGVGFTEYLSEVRLKKAKQLLRMSTDTIDQIAAATGFSSSSYFSAIFKKHEGITPSEFRANNR
ncbi:response regulator containing CheY-like receiver domain and AraC-type DNA-binding domain [Desulfosporosinus acidiphilus SJ4]|uniref:Stage 0 sporulation protein A homolog n=1 Tax=Desulfosporosinus acidiphilus (strain DSM 22704 / JCM 16185 / SJ4) TaxID=646529 RepID=I4DC50_DESAJ|nr:response regulator [Desulfosporosinus acidiphilus]AFM43374.1 response regulator containing CheY-like receiver domain and AraC-type DNA-binding domain [Desulfosporosinus acidiphilus SJ4]